jgi:rubrerythrin
MTTIKETLREAIQGEIESHQLYTDAVALVKAEQVKETLRQLAGEELGHKATLERMLASPGRVRRSVQTLRKAPIQDYKVGDHLVVQPLSPDSTFQDVCSSRTSSTGIWRRRTRARFAICSRPWPRMSFATRTW